MKNETPLDPLLNQISSTMPISRELKESLNGFANIRYYPRDFVLIKAGEVVRGLTVMLKGVAHAIDKGQDSQPSFWFATESHLLTPAVKNGKDIIAAHDVTVLEDSFIAFIAYTDLAKMMQEHPGLDKAIRDLQLRYNSNLSLRNDLKKQDIPQKLRSLQEQHPGLGIRTDPALITTYLGITPEEYKQLTS